MEKEVLKERLTKLVEIGLSKNKTLDFNDVNDFFAGETLTPEELEFVYTYLERKKIDVLRAATEDMAADDFDKDDIKEKLRPLSQETGYRTIKIPDLVITELKKRKKINRFLRRWHHWLSTPCIALSALWPDS